MDDTDLLFYEGLHGGYAHNDFDIAKHVDLLVGSANINLEDSKTSEIRLPGLLSGCLSIQF